MSKYQTLIDALAAEGLSDFPWMAFGPSNDAAPPDYYDEVVAVRSDAQVQVICRAPRDRDDACTADMTYIAKANPVTVRALLADLEVAEKALAALAQQAQEPVAWMLHLAGKPQRASVSKPSLDGYHPDFSLRPLVYGDTTPPAPQVPAPVDEQAEFEAWDGQIRKTVEAVQDPDTVPAFHNGYYTLTPGELRRVVLALHPAVKPMTAADTVQVYGVKNGQQTLIGTAPMPPRMKARELACEQFGHFEDDDGSDADLCFCALEQLIEHMDRTAHHGITAKEAEK